MTVDGIAAHLDRVEPRRLVSGRASVVYVEGWCFHPRERVTALEFLVGGIAHRVDTFPYAREDVARVFGRRARQSGFCEIVPLASRAEPGSRTLELRANLTDGRVLTAEVGQIFVEQAPPSPRDWNSRASDESPVAICMATFNPKTRLFRRQVESIKAQTHRNFVCLLSDDGSNATTLAEIKRVCAEDSRFVLLEDRRSLGFYRNFERCLWAVPQMATFVALSDHDDEWHPDKLVTLIDALGEPGVVLAYSDMNIVTEEGRLMAPSYWTGRANNYTDLGSLILANTVTGAACLFRRELLEDVLPFPPNVGHPYHDHWIACVALASGRIAYVPRPLYDYVQHEENVIGHFVPKRSRAALPKRVGKVIARPRSHMSAARAHSRAIYFADVVRLEMFARTLQLRLGTRLPRNSAVTVRRVASLSESRESLGWLIARAARNPRSDVTLGAELQLTRGVFWRRTRKLRALLALLAP